MVNAIEDGTLHDDDTDSKGVDHMIASTQILPDAAAWAGAQLGCVRAVAKVKTSTEKAFFFDNYHIFQNDGSEANNYTAIVFGRFAGMWN
jgi:hypothetical protein